MRSVHRELVGCVIEPRKAHVVRADALGYGRRQHGSAEKGLARKSHRGHRAWHASIGEHQEPGRPCSLRPDKSWLGRHVKQPWPALGCRLGWERKNGTRAVLPIEGDEVRQEGWQGVGAVRSNDEGGELIRWTRWSEGTAGKWNCWRERCREYRVLQASQRNNDR